MCMGCIAKNINRNVYMYLNTRIFPTTGYARVLLFIFIRRELGGTSTGCLFQFTYCDSDMYFILHFNVSISLRMIGYGMLKLLIGYLNVFEPTNPSTPPPPPPSDDMWLLSVIRR